jgi:magnesium transporter
MKPNHDWKELSGRLNSLFQKKEKPTAPELSELVQNCDAQNIALAIEELKTEDAVETFKAIPSALSSDVLALTGPELAKKILKHIDPGEVKKLIKKMNPKDAAAVMAAAPGKEQKEVLKSGKMPGKIVADAKKKVEYPQNSAVRLMTTQYLKIPKGKKIKEALQLVRKTDLKEKIPEDIFVVEEDHQEKTVQVRGVISIRGLVTHDDETKVDDVMEKEVVCVNPFDSQIDVAALLSKYRFQTLPVVDKKNHLVGVIQVDKLLMVMIARLRSVYSKAVGTDAQKMAKLSAFQEAKLRVPWLLVTMAIELVAGLVIHRYDAILKKVILLASFMPVISAISGNVGLQAAAITVRAVDAKIQGDQNIFKSVSREFATSILMALACGVVLGTVGAIWAHHIPFGLVIGGALICSMITAGLMGTIIPMVSKKLGFDPATTAGPFETSVQDIVGFGVFLWLATTFQHWIT